MKTENQLPKNIRQIGSPNSNMKLYVEDYVVTFLKSIAKDKTTFVRGAILFGEKKIIEHETIIFIRGAIEGENIELDLDETVFDDGTWREIYEKKEMYFPKLEVMGWALSRMGFSVRLNDKIKKTHFENFPGEGKVLYMVDVLEGEDAFYIYRGQDLVRQNGYYIYYEKNPMMQSYLEQRNQRLKEINSYETMLEAKRDERIIKQFRSSVNQKKRKTKNKRRIRKISAAASIALLFLLTGSIFYVKQVDGRKSIQSAVKGAVAAMSDGAKSQLVKEEVSTKESNSTEKKETQKEATSKTVQELQRTYIVRKGDKLVSIARKEYGSAHYLELILKANNLKTDDTIYPGQKIIIPSISN